MLRLVLLVGMLMGALAACTPSYENNGSGVYRIRGDGSKVQFRMLDSVNSLRSAAGLPTVQLNSQLNAAAATHARDMSVQNRPWHFGSDGSSPLDRAQRAGYFGQFLGEAISESYETELETLSAWMEQPGTRSVIMDPQARNMGFSWFQESSGKIWWTLEMGS
ncbi:CAP domain-containing protein [Ruegeria sp. 2205SS24-7]|uniref:CAP domain-containing protein n=1 Tax=Ruegeria discodermiae TaxID=3064389 RepID=UPI0027412056|nr:CAP domain-containing protein [Ruegeria sp. 2205SS24-7]MDP5219990.1 CAP domain-containing protein [Ruegeria sp. 2205SS24-7]